MILRIRRLALGVHLLLWWVSVQAQEANSVPIVRMSRRPLQYSPIRQWWQYLDRCEV